MGLLPTQGSLPYSPYLQHCSGRRNECTISIIISWTGNRKFKVATKLNERLKLTCPVIQEIANVQSRGMCADLAKGYEDANGLYFDATNKMCSIQHCNKNSISATGDLTARISIMFEEKFYPRSEYMYVFS